MFQPGRRRRGRVAMGPGQIFPIDEAGGVAPQWAFGTKKLVSGYEGPSIRIIRASDSTESDIGFVGQDLDVATLETFLSGTTGKVMVSYDQSGNGNDRVQTVDASRPSIGVSTVDGLPGIYMPGSGGLLLPAISSSRQLFDFYGVSEPINSNGRCAFLELGATPNQALFFTSAITGGMGPMRLLPGTANSSFIQQMRPSLYEARWEVGAGAATQNTETVTGSGATAFAMSGGSMGFATTAAGYSSFNETCAIGYTRTLTDPERTALRAALNTLFAITPNPPNRVIFEGDSITAGGPSGDYKFDTFAKQAVRLLTQPAHVYNLSEGGNYLQTIVVEASYDLNVGRLLDAYTDNRIVFLHMGTNDLTVNGRTAAEIYADIVDFAGRVRTDGGKVIISTLLPNATWDATEQTTWADLNALIRAGVGTIADGLCDFQADATMGPFAAASDTALYPDGLHPSWLGHSHMAPVAAAAIQALLL